MIDSYTFGSTLYGPRLVVFGAIHGNEPCGTEAIRRLIDEIGRGTIRIHGGLLTLVPVANPEAYKQKKRFVEKNLNRVFKPTTKKKNLAYEEKLAEHLREILLTSDYLLDLHSMSCGNDPFVVGHVDEGNPDMENFTYATGIGTTVAGRDALYAGTGERATDQYMYASRKIGICLECGQHEDTHAIQVAYDAIIGVLKHLGMISGTPSYAINHQHLHLSSVVYKEAPGHMLQHRQHGDHITQGTAIARYYDGKILSSSQDGLIILPKEGAIVGEERYYLGEEV